jgi:hypothetical protein
MDVSKPTEERESLGQKKLGQEKEAPKFLEQQYNALRQEIEQASDRAFKIFAASVLVVPTGLTLGGVASAEKNVLPLIKVLLPLLLLAFYAMYAAQMFSTRRAGLYIESYIEPRLLNRTRGWESWVSERRFAYDSQMNVAFFSLSIVYYLGTVCVAVTAGPPLPSNIMLLAIFYVLAGLAMILLVLLVPLRQLKEEVRIEKVYDKRLSDTPEHLQKQFLKKLRERKPNPKLWRLPHIQDRGLIKRYHYHTETDRYRPISKDVRLTIGEGLRNITTVVGVVTVIALPSWAAWPIYSVFERLIQQPGIVLVLTVALALALLVLLSILYYHFIGRNIGAKIDIIFRRPSQANHSYGTRAIVQTSLGKSNDEKSDDELFSKSDDELFSKSDDELLTEIVEEIVEEMNAITEHKTKLDRED